MEFRGSITQHLISLSTLRSGGRPPPRKTRFPAAGPALPDGIGYPQGFNERFHIFEMILLSRASWRKVRPSSKLFIAKQLGTRSDPLGPGLTPTCPPWSPASQPSANVHEYAR